MLQFLSFLPMVNKIIDKIFGDKSERDTAKARIRELELRGQLEPLLRQIDVNIEEAKSNSKFIAGWRPAFAWMCVGAMGIGFCLQVILPAAIILTPVFGGTLELSTAMKQVVAQLKSIDLSIYTTALLGMLGLGTMRSYEKARGVYDSTFKRTKTVTADEFFRLYSKRFGGVTVDHKRIIYELFEKLDSLEEQEKDSN